MSITEDVQSLQPGTMLSFFVLDASELGGGIIRFQSFDNRVIVWQGLDYAPWPIKAEGFARTSDQQPTPRLGVGNIDGSISLLCMSFDDLVGAQIIRKRTFAAYIDAVNYPDGINPNANPNEEFRPEVWYIERKSGESREVVEFELSSVLDFMGMKLPGRQIIANHCSFAYRGGLCNYTGPAVADAQGNPTADPLLDRCGKKISDCKLRQWPDDVLNFGGYPAAGLVRT